MILVAHEGQLVGLVTVKDVLRHEAKAHHKEAQLQASSPATPSRSHRRTNGNSTQGGRDPHESFSDDGWQSWDEDARVNGGGLEVVLEEVYAWARIKGSRLYNIVYGAVRSRAGSISVPGSGGGVGVGSGAGRDSDVGFEYELESGHR